MSSDYHQATICTEDQKNAFEHLKSLLQRGRLHHATYRNMGTVWEGLWFYEKDDDNSNHRGFTVAGCINKSNPYIDQAIELVRHTGISVGSYGRG